MPSLSFSNFLKILIVPSSVYIFKFCKFRHTFSLLSTFTYCLPYDRFFRSYIYKKVPNKHVTLIQSINQINPANNYATQYILSYCIKQHTSYMNLQVSDLVTGKSPKLQPQQLFPRNDVCHQISF